MRIWVVLPLALIWLSHSVFAEVVTGLYQQSELVTDQSSRERLRATEDALRKVLVRVSGNSSVISQLGGNGLLQSPSRLVEAYRYESTEEQLQRGEELVPAQRLVLNFSRSEIEKLLRDAGLPMWSANRPSVLLWLVRDDVDAGRELVSLQDRDSLREALQESAAERGLPLVLPLLDLEDRLSLSTHRVWRLDRRAIEDASQRYGSDAIAVGRYSQTSSGTWLADWSLWHKEYRKVFDVEAQQEEQLLAEGVAEIGDFLADIYALVYDRDLVNQVLLELDSVVNFSDYVAALDYLQRLDVVRQVELVEVRGEQLQLLLRLASDADALQSALELDRRLQPVPRNTLEPDSYARTGPAALQRLYFRWPG